MFWVPLLLLAKVWKGVQKFCWARNMLGVHECETMVIALASLEKCCLKFSFMKKEKMKNSWFHQFLLVSLVISDEF